MLLNVLGTELQQCSCQPRTGYYRDGFCKTGQDDMGMHTVCAVMTDTFLIFSKNQGNDLITPKSEWNFPGLVAGDRWCLCAKRWLEAEHAGVAPLIQLAACYEKTLEIIPIDTLKCYSI